MKVVLIQKCQLDNQNPNFCMGWPGLYLLDNINQLGSVCTVHGDIIVNATNRTLNSHFHIKSNRCQYLNTLGHNNFSFF